MMRHLYFLKIILIDMIYCINNKDVVILVVVEKIHRNKNLKKVIFVKKVVVNVVVMIDIGIYEVNVVYVLIIFMV